MRLIISFAILCVMSMILLVTGLRGFFIRRPVVYPARYHYWFVMLGITPAFISSAELIFDPDFGSFELISFIPSLMFAGLLVYCWWEMRGYIASGVTDESFQTALHTSLEKLNLPYKESLSRVELTSVGAHLQASVRRWRGMVELKVKPRRHKQTLRDIAESMNEYYKGTPVKVNLAPSIIDTAIGIVGLIVLILLIVTRAGRGV